MMNYAFLLDVLVSILLATTIVWCVLLNRRLKGLRRNQGELATLIAELNLATSRAEAGISVLKSNAEEAGASLQTSIEQAVRLNDDLAYLSERGSRLVERLDGPTKRARHTAFASRNRPTFDTKDPGNGFGRRKEAPETGPRGGAAEFDERDDILDNAGFGDASDRAARGRAADLGELGPEQKNVENKLLDALKAAR